MIVEKYGVNQLRQMFLDFFEGCPNRAIVFEEKEGE